MLQRFEDFVLLPSNRDAYEVVRAWTETGAPRTIVLLGPPGVGKTHLARAALHDLGARGERVHRGSVENHLRDYLAAMRRGSLAEHHGRWREKERALVLEHLEDLRERRACTDVVMHLLFAREDAGLRTLLTASLAAAEARRTPWLERAMLPDRRVVALAPPAPGELESLAARLRAWPERDGWPCRNVAELLGELRRRAFAASLA